LTEPVLGIKRFVATRWLSRFQCIDRIIDLYPSLLVFFMEEVNEKDLTDTQRANATTILKSLQSWKTLMWLLFLHEILYHFYEFSKVLQSEKLNIAKLLPIVNDVVSYLKLTYLPPQSSTEVHYGKDFNNVLKQYDKVNATGFTQVTYKFSSNKNPDERNKDFSFDIYDGINEINEFKADTIKYSRTLCAEMDYRHRSRCVDCSSYYRRMRARV